MSNVSTRRRPLDRWLLTRKAGFPANPAIPYPDRFRSVSLYLLNEVHPNVEKSALQHGAGFLTDHGPKHIDTVIRRASDLLSYPAKTYPQLRTYEVYILLMAIHFHDVGNLYGRKEHETKLRAVMDRLCDLVGNEMVERHAIMRIARAHGGTINGDKDTIGPLPPEDPILDFRVRYRALAAILRFADELADDARRAASLLHDLDLVPPPSQAYHMYARALQAVDVRPHQRSVQLLYILTRDQTRLVSKDAKEVYLLDEIYARTVKMHYEREYCMRFTQGLVHIDAIDVRIEVYEAANSPDLCIEPMGYRLQSQGYPGADNTPINQLIADQEIKTGAELFSTLYG